mgnify:CR=1 FL=1
MEEKILDYDLAGSRILGRDIAKIIDSSTYQEIINILDKEVCDSSDFNLSRDMLSYTYNFDSNEFMENIELLKSLKLGIMESVNF